MNVSVIGLGRSGLSCIQLLKRKGINVFASDAKEVKIDEEENLKIELGRNSEKILDSDLIILSPGVRMDHEIVKKAVQKAIPVIGEIEFASRFLRGRMVAITGTNGKTTTSMLIYHVLKEAKYDTKIAGNMAPGVPLSSIVDDTRESTISVVEVSTFQLESISTFHPQISVLLNISEDHLDRHGTMEEYERIKGRIFENQDEEDFAVINLDDRRVLNLSKRTRAKRIFFSREGPADTRYYHDKLLCHNEEICSLREIPSKIVLEDALAAISVLCIIGVKKNDIIRGIKTFNDIPHRLEHVTTINGRTFVNNSMCTNPVAFEKSLEVVCRNRPLGQSNQIIVIVGGKSKAVDIAPIIDSIIKRTKFCILMGETSNNIEQDLLGKGYKKFIKVYTMDNAVKEAFRLSEKGDTILLSPGFASFDKFTDFQERGEFFKKAVRKLKRETVRREA